MADGTKIREKWIDNAKGIAMLLVILAHTSNSLTGIWNFHFLYGIHLVMFFLLSGYTLRKKTLTRTFINQKFSRLMAPYFITCAAIIVTDLFNNWYFSHDISIKTSTESIALNLLRDFFASGSIDTFGAVEVNTIIGAIWFLPAMFFAVLIFQFLLSVTEEDWILGSATGLIALTGYISGKFLWLPFSIQSAMLAAFFLWIGFEIRKHSLLSKVKIRHYLIAQVILLFGIYHDYSYIGFVKVILNDTLISIPVGLSGCLLIYLLAVKDTKGKVLAYIGRHSLTVLCVHLYALNTMKRYFGMILDKQNLTGNAREWAYVFIHILFACAGMLLIEFINLR